MDRVGVITEAGYKVGMQWECDFHRDILKKHPELETLPIVQQNPLNTGDALYGGRTEAIRLHYKIKDGETIQYVDVVSLYSWVCKYFKFPVGLPPVIVGGKCRDIQTMLRKEGVIKCSILPPKHLYLLVLPFPCNNKLLFCLCQTCAIEHDISTECTHETVTEGALTGTWVMDEVRLIVQKVYEVTEIFEVYEYEVTQYNRETGDGGLFVKYINTFLKLKAEASGYPSCVRTPTDVDQYIQTFFANEGIMMDKDAIRLNASKRALAKLCLN
jgi:hypothetical protein